MQKYGPGTAQIIDFTPEATCAGGDRGKQTRWGGKWWNNHSNRTNLTEGDGNAVRSWDSETIAIQNVCEGMG